MTEDLLQKLYAQYRVPVHIRKHMEKVAAVALYIGQILKQKGEKIDLVKLRQAALLHDVLKLCDFRELDLENFEQDVTAEDIQFWSALMKSCHKDGHITAAVNMLNDIGENEIAEIVKKHRYTCLIEPKEKPATWEEKILYYSDKRVKHDRIATLAERLTDGRQRYFPDGNPPATDHLVETALYELESEITKKAGINPEDINEKSVAVYNG